MDDHSGLMILVMHLPIGEIPSHTTGETPRNAGLQVCVGTACAFSRISHIDLWVTVIVC